MKKLYFIISLLSLVFIISSCNLDYFPQDQMTTESISTNPDALLNVTNGNYALFKDGLEFNGYVDNNNCYVRQYFQLSDFASDDVVCGQVTEDPFFYSFTYTHSPDQTNSRFFWYVSYKIINGANIVIETITNKTDELTAQDNQLLGENYFLRAFVTFNLLKFYSKPYNIGDPNVNLGVILRQSTSDASQEARATVKECYDFVESDLLRASELMTYSRGVMYASKEAAWAILSRLYLYKEDYDLSITYADLVINSGRFLLETENTFPDMFANSASHSEPIFIVAFTDQDNLGKFGSIASMYYSDGNSGWGEEFASPALQDLMAINRNDVRWSMIDTLKNNLGNIVIKNGLEVFWVLKFSFQNGDPNLSSPIFIRLAEMYLNKAESYAHKGDEFNAIENVNIIRQNRGLADDLFDAGNLLGGKTAIDIVLDEKRFEFAFEGFRTTDLIRNKKNIERNYWGYHISNLKVNDVNLSILPSQAGFSNLSKVYDDPKIQYYIPIDEILANPLCSQNP
jgi:hypothetical protein